MFQVVSREKFLEMRHSIGDGRDCDWLKRAAQTVIDGVRVGSGATLGAGALVLQDLAEGATAVGSPARPIERGV